MTREVLITKVLQGLLSCEDKEGVLLSELFTSFELHDFTNRIVGQFPPNLEYRLTLLNEELFNNIPDKEEFLLNLFKSTITSYYKELIGDNNKENKTKLEHHIFFLSGLFLFNKGEDIDTLFNKMITFYNQYIINKKDVYKETDAANTVINVDDENVIRLFLNEMTSTLIPTEKQKQHFKQLL